jgi:hypothetical protein
MQYETYPAVQKQKYEKWDHEIEKTCESDICFMQTIYHWQPAYFDWSAVQMAGIFVFRNNKPWNI